MVYKETHSNQDELGRTIPTTKIDPMKDIWTGTWRESSPANPEGAQPENALTGTIFTVNANRQDPLIIPAKYSKLRIWRNTDVAKLKPGEQVVTGNGMLGHEWDEDLDNGFRPAGLIRLSETKMSGVQYPMDHGSVYDQGTATHALTLYRAKSGALVFGTGAVQYTWGLDNHHTNPTSRGGATINPYSNRVGYDPYGPSKVIQQATMNLFADMGVQPANPQRDLVPATQSTDKTAPITQIASPAENGSSRVPSSRCRARPPTRRRHRRWRGGFSGRREDLASGGGHRSLELRGADADRLRHADGPDPGERRHRQHRNAECRAQNQIQPRTAEDERGTNPVTKKR